MRPGRTGRRETWQQGRVRVVRPGHRANGAVADAPAPLAFLAGASEPIRAMLGASVELAQFLGTAGTLTLTERRLLADQALILLEQNYVHLPLKVAMHAVNPLQRLRLLKNRLERQTTSTMDPEWKFHAEMSEIFHSVRDLHTNYLLPNPFSGKIAYLPFMIEEYLDSQGPHYIVTEWSRDSPPRASGRAPRSGSGTASQSIGPSRSTPTASPAATSPPAAPAASSR